MHQVVPAGDFQVTPRATPNRLARAWYQLKKTAKSPTPYLTVFGIFLWLFVPFVKGPIPTGTETFWFLTKILVWAAALIGVSYLTGEPPRWQWGIPEGSDKRK